MKEIVYSKAALKTLTRMPANTSKPIRAKLAQYAEDPAGLAQNVIKLQGVEGALRLRVGDWRILFTEDGEVIAVIKVAPRGGAYD